MSQISSLFVTRLYHAELAEHGYPVDMAELEASCWSIAEDDEAVQETGRDPELVKVLCAEFERHVTPETRRAEAYVDRDVPDGPFDAPHELALRVRGLGV